MKHLIYLLMTAIVSFNSLGLQGSSASVAKVMDKRVDTMLVETSRLATDMVVTVAVPSSYNDSVDKHYPVVYLLNGFDGDYTDYATRMNLDSLATVTDAILVCPDGRDSWYWDSPVDPKMQMESFIIEDLVPTVDARLRTRDDRRYRAITGLSMGGHGALWLAMRHKDVFGSAGSMSGGVDITKPKWHKSWKMHLRLGSYESNPARWKEHSVINLVPTLNDGELNIMFSCGTGDFFYEVNNSLDRALTARGIKHRYTTAPGNHSWKYWTATLPTQLTFFAEQFRK